MYKKISYFAIVSLVSIISSSCGTRDEKAAEIVEDVELDVDVVKTMAEHFDSVGFEYTLKEEPENDRTFFSLGVQGDKEEINVIICIYTASDYYQIICWSNESIPKERMTAGMIAANDYNSSARVVSSYIDVNGRIAFWVGRNTDGGAFSEEGFSSDFYMTVNAADNDTSLIYLNALKN